MVTNEKQKKRNIRIPRCFFDYRALTKQGLSANIDEQCDHLFRMDGNDLKTHFVDINAFIKALHL